MPLLLHNLNFQAIFLIKVRLRLILYLSEIYCPLWGWLHLNIYAKPFSGNEKGAIEHMSIITASEYGVTF